MTVSRNVKDGHQSHRQMARGHVVRSRHRWKGDYSTSCCVRYSHYNDIEIIGIIKQLVPLKWPVYACLNCGVVYVGPRPVVNVFVERVLRLRKHHPVVKIDTVRLHPPEVCLTAHFMHSGWTWVVDAYCYICICVTVDCLSTVSVLCMINFRGEIRGSFFVWFCRNLHLPLISQFFVRRESRSYYLCGQK